MSMLAWDEYYLTVCKAVASNSKCHSRQIGAILVKDKSIIATGYNGPPRGVPHCGDERISKDTYLRQRIALHGDSSDIGDTCPRKILSYKSGEGLQFCIAAHAERNTICNAARMGVRVGGCDIYMTCGIPCKDCLIEIINSGIIGVVVTDLVLYDEQSKYIIEHSHLSIRSFDGASYGLQRLDI